MAPVLAVHSLYIQFPRYSSVTPLVTPLLNHFLQVFRLAQLTVEYLLYVQDCLQTTNAWLQQDRGTLERHLQAGTNYTAFRST